MTVPCGTRRLDRPPAGADCRRQNWANPVWSGPLARGGGRLEAVAGAVDGADPLPVATGALEFAAEVADVDVDQEVGLDELALPDLSHQLPARPAVTRSGRQGGEEVDLRGGEWE